MDGWGEREKEEVEVPGERERGRGGEGKGVGRKAGREGESVRLTGWLGGLRQVAVTHSVSHSRSFILADFPAGHAPRLACWEEDVRGGVTGGWR